MEIKIASNSDIKKLIPTYQELRPHLSKENIGTQLMGLLDKGFQVIYIGDEQEAYSLAGFRSLDILFSGKTLYIDDLITHPNHRGNGYANALLDWIIIYAKKCDFDTLSLDSGFARKDAYRLYLNKGLEITATHFSKAVKELN